MSDEQPSKAEEEGYYESANPIFGVTYQKEAAEKREEAEEKREEYERRNEWSSNGEVYYGRPAETYGLPGLVGRIDEPLNQPPKEPLDLPPGVGRLSDLGDADLTNAHLRGASMPDGSIHD